MACQEFLTESKFLICRVELKVGEGGVSLFQALKVPNLPCGVERKDFHLLIKLIHQLPVPNLPCGVESSTVCKHKETFKLVFLICRVELKAEQATGTPRNLTQPWFLICRVELKEGYTQLGFKSFDEFLICRVELKAADMIFLFASSFVNGS